MKDVTFYRDTWAEVDLDAICKNVRNAVRHVSDGTEVIAVVKANAYGHGYVPVALTALEAGASRLAVAFLDEALLLRRAGIAAPILVMGASRPQDVNEAAENGIALTVFQAEWLEEAKRQLTSSRPLLVHVKFDSGMGRLGIRTKAQLQQCLAHMQDGIFVLEGVYTHFATADEVNTDYFEKQYELFLQQLRWLRDCEVNPKLVHCANSAAGLRFPDRVFNAIRLGISMYGLTPSLEMNDLLPYPLHEAFSLHSKIVHVKQVEAGSSISYGATYTSSAQEWIATVAIGYADGWIRKMQGFEVLAEGIYVPIVGRVCMDQMMIRLPHHMPVGTKVTLVGKQAGACISMDDVALHAGTINYEVPCLISFRVPRVYKKNNEITYVENLLME